MDNLNINLKRIQKKNRCEILNSLSESEDDSLAEAEELQKQIEEITKQLIPLYYEHSLKLSRMFEEAPPKKQIQNIQKQLRFQKIQMQQRRIVFNQFIEAEQSREQNKILGSIRSGYVINRIKFKEKKKIGKNNIADKIREIIYAERKYWEEVSEDDGEMGNIIISEVGRKREKVLKKKDGSDDGISSKTRKKSEKSIRIGRHLDRIHNFPATQRYYPKFHTDFNQEESYQKEKQYNKTEYAIDLDRHKLQTENMLGHYPSFQARFQQYQNHEELYQPKQNQQTSIRVKESFIHIEDPSEEISKHISPHSQNLNSNTFKNNSLNSFKKIRQEITNKQNHKKLSNKQSPEFIKTDNKIRQSNLSMNANKFYDKLKEYVPEASVISQKQESLNGQIYIKKSGSSLKQRPESIGRYQLKMNLHQNKSQRNKRILSDSFVNTQQSKLMKQRKMLEILQTQVSQTLRKSSKNLRMTERSVRSSIKQFPENQLAQNVKYLFSQFMQYLLLSQIYKYPLKNKQYQILSKLTLKKHFSQTISQADLSSNISKYLEQKNHQISQIILFKIFKGKSSLDFQELSQAFATSLNFNQFQRLKPKTLTEVSLIRVEGIMEKLFAVWVQLEYFQYQIQTFFYDNMPFLDEFFSNITEPQSQTISQDKFINYLNNGKPNYSSKRLFHKKIQLFLAHTGKNLTKSNFIEWITSKNTQNHYHRHLFSDNTAQC